MSAREVELTGGAPWGFRMHGGADQHQPLRISRVNPGRKASLSGIREGDVISSINGRPTRGMSNADAHAALRQAGPLLRLGLNQDKELSPRRRSIGKLTELKRPSQLVAEVSGATPQAPVYASIRQAPALAPAAASSLGSVSPLPAALTALTSLGSTPPVRSLAHDEPPRIHPTNPFYTTLPPNLGASRLPVPNGRPSFSNVDRTKKDNHADYSELKSPSFFTQTYDTSSLPYLHHNENGIKSGVKSSAADASDPFSYAEFDQYDNRRLPNNVNEKNPFETKRNSDPFEKYLRQDNLNGKSEFESNIPGSQSENNFNRREEITKTSTITEHKINEVEEVRTIKKIVLNGCGNPDETIQTSRTFSSPNTNGTHQFDTYKSSEENRVFIAPANNSGRSELDFSPSDQQHQHHLTRAPPPRAPQHGSSLIGRRPASPLLNHFTSPTSPPPASPSAAEPTAPPPGSSKPPAPAPAPVKPEPTPSPTKPVWRPGAPTPPPAASPVPPAPAPPAPPGPRSSTPAPPPPPPPPVWTPSSAGPSPQPARKTFRPVHFEETPPARRKFGSTEQNGCTSGSESEGRLRTSLSAPAAGLNSLGGSSSRLPRVQNPTVTLLQKAREGQIPRGSNYLQDRESARLPRDRPEPPRGDPVHALRAEYASERDGASGARAMADTHRVVDGIGPTTKEGMPVALRSEVKDQSRWYKKMYDTIHKNKYDDDYVTIRYKNRRGEPLQRVSNKSQYAYFDPRSGYLSEPEGGRGGAGGGAGGRGGGGSDYDSDVTHGPRRRTASVQEDSKHDVISPYLPSNKYSTLASARASQEVYRNQPGRIENYVPGKSSVVDKEAKQWWDEVMDIFDGQNISSTTSLPQSSSKDRRDLTAQILSKSNMARALKESGYESDSTLVFRRRAGEGAGDGAGEGAAPLSPAERRAAYRDLQAGGEPPLRGFRSPAPQRTESPRRYVESDVNIHYRCPVRHDPLPLVPERELARQQAEHMKRLYREQKRNKYLQELQDMQSRRHQDNFLPKEKSIVPLNRYDEAERVVARALYAFNGQTARELSFRKGDLINVRRQIDANWYEGELHGRHGLFPYNYVEILKGDVAQSPRKPSVIEGRARAKFDFTAQTNLELPLKKGELVTLTRRIDHNWWEGRRDSRTGIFPDSYITVLQEPSQSKPEPESVQSTLKPVASPAAHGLMNGTAKRSMGPHSYMPTPNNPALSNAPQPTQPLQGYTARPAAALLTPSERGYGPPTAPGVDLNNSEPLYVDTNAEAVPYRAMYKYRPQNPDELELCEGDTVYVLERCDDGWYVGSSQRTGRFGTFPGNYVERI